MNILSIIITNCIGICLVGLVIVSSSMSRRRKGLADRLFTSMLLIVGSCCFMEMVSFLVDGHLFFGARAINMLANTWLYFFNITFSTIWCVYVDCRLYNNPKRITKELRPLLICSAICIASVFPNVFFQYLFRISDDNVYERTILAYIFFVIPVIYVLITTFFVHRRRKQSKDVYFFPIWSFLLPFFVGVILQTLIYGISLAWCSSAIGLASLYMSLQNQLVYQDPLTHLFNRYYLNDMLASGSWLHGTNRGGIMLDVDYFKAINDTYGHSSGDQALTDTAFILRRACPDDAAVIRFAGDEFIVLLPFAQAEKILELEKKILSEVRKFNETAGRPYKLSLSMGHGIFINGTSSSDSFLDEMDRAMYENKRKRHLSGELKDRRTGRGMGKPENAAS